MPDNEERSLHHKLQMYFQECLKEAKRAATMDEVVRHLRKAREIREAIQEWDRYVVHLR